MNAKWRAQLNRLDGSEKNVRCWVVFVSFLYLAISLLCLAQTTGESKGVATLLEGDTVHYLRIAQDFAAGDFSFSYVEKLPHRQPLYPMLLAPVLAITGKNLWWLGIINVICAWVSSLVLYFTAERIAGATAAVVAVICFWMNPFLLAQTTTHLLTEPLHVLWMLLILPALFAYLKTSRPVYLLAVSICAALDYLTRANGLFVWISILSVAALQIPFAPPGEMIRKLTAIVAACVVFAVLVTPSWWPRWHYFHAPLHHGYLSNYMWVDTKESAHTGDTTAIYSWRDYLAHHGIGDIFARWRHGIWKVVFQAPFRTEKIPVLFFLSATGLGLTIWRGKRSQRLIVAFGAIQLLPLIWTNLSNPTVRVPWGAFFPVQIWLTVFLMQILSRQNMTPGPTDHPALASR